ncbi:uncharacterized protein LOC113313225 [Papaver somniferum]|uniref:uncharacterized protein LOC113313225 n=1 Tax=Papaver somniferum TaxID=3469 RepID=UPI000E6FBCB3|nr:uncharacterized protein LOC113313225 [Papaver somniferum]
MLVILKKVLVQSIMIWIILARILVIIYFLRCLVAGPLEINSKVAVILWAWELLTQVLQVQRIDNTHPWCWCCLRFLRNTCYWNGNTRSHRTGKLWSTSGTQGSLHALEKSCSRMNFQDFTLNGKRWIDCQETMMLSLQETKSS